MIIAFQLLLIFVIFVSFMVNFHERMTENEKQNSTYVCMLSIAAFTVTVIL